MKAKYGPLGGSGGMSVGSGVAVHDGAGFRVRVALAAGAVNEGGGVVEDEPAEVSVGVAAVAAGEQAARRVRVAEKMLHR
jgi:hypothetical protein